MSFFPTEDQAPRKDRELIPEATHEAYCYGVVDLGTQERKPYMGKPKDPARALMLFFEFTEQLRQFKDEGPMEPMVKNMKYTFFTDEKSSLAKACLGWLGKKVQDVDFDNLAGTPASITIKHEVSQTNGKTYDNMTTIAPLSEKLVPLMPPMANPKLNFSIMEHGFDSKEFQAMLTGRYEWVAKIIMESKEYQEYMNGPKGQAASNNKAITEDDIPFK